MRRAGEDEAELARTWYRGKAEGMDRAGGIVVKLALAYFKIQKDDMGRLLRDLALEIGKEAEKLRKEWENK